MHRVDRRSFVKGAVGALAATGASAQPASLDLDALPDLWDVDRSVANLENAYWGVDAARVDDEYLEQTRFLNRRNVVVRARRRFAGRERTAAMEHVRTELAALMGAPARSSRWHATAPRRCRTSSCSTGRLKPGDAVMYADLDYDEMQQAMASLRHTRGANVLTFAIPGAGDDRQRPRRLRRAS